MSLPKKAFAGGIFDEVQVDVWDVKTKEIIFTGSITDAAARLGVQKARISQALSLKYRLLKKYAIRTKKLINMEIKDLQLTEDDFKLLIDGLDSLPSKDMAGDMMVDLIETIIMKGDKPPRDIELDKKRERADKEKKRQAVIENTKILQGKLLMFKRYLIENNALAQVNEMLK